MNEFIIVNLILIGIPLLVALISIDISNRQLRAAINMLTVEVKKIEKQRKEAELWRL